MPKNNKNSINLEDIKAWEDFKNQKFLDGDKGEIFKKSVNQNKIGRASCRERVLRLV